MAQNNQIGNRDVNQPCIVSLRNALKGGDTVYIIGKGPSLDELTNQDFEEFPNAPVLCVNESVHAIEKLNIKNPLFCIQYDKLKGVSNKPKRATWFLSEYSWEAQNGERDGAIRYELNKIWPNKPNLTAATAISMAKLAGADQAVMLGFDAAFSKNCDYAKSIGHGPKLPGKSDTRFVLFSESGIPKRAVSENVRLIWQSPKDFWMVCVVLKSGGNYNMKHVNAIQKQIDAHLKSPHGILLFTDVAEAKPWKKVMLSKDWPGWFSKIEMFRPDINYRGGVLFTDLDNYFGRDFILPKWDKMEVGKIYAPRDPYRNLWASGLMAWRLGSVNSPFIEFSKNPVFSREGNRVFGDQEIINEAMKGKYADLSALMSSASYKKDKPKKDSVDCVYFHGKPKPWDVGWTVL